MSTMETEDVPRPAALLEPSLEIPTRSLLGSGPSNCPPSVYQASAWPLVGFMSAECFRVMDDIKLGLQYAFQTRNELTLAISASGHGGMETCLGNLLERGDVALITQIGIWGERAADMATRYGADVKKLTKAAGEVVSLAEVEAALSRHRPTLLFVTHGDSSTGTLQPISELGPLCHRYNCLLVVDAVASLGGAPLFADRWELDAVYTGSQKVLGAPPGLAPVTFSPRARAKIAARRTPPPVFYFDLNLIGNYWGCDDQPRKYHHTIPISMLYTLREALVVLARDGLTNSWRRHSDSTRQLYEGVGALGFSCFVQRPELRLPTICALVPPANVSIPSVLQHALQRNQVEIAGGLGPTAGRVIRIGLMGQNATQEKAELALRVLREALEAQGALDTAKL
ncbi:hypothetical protein B566_EDAN008406 [Ephemera danica]|nr:hypothetical protein B566_EDAN008406 [Ephemera danica]